jgi:hypothetical protein
VCRLAIATDYRDTRIGREMVTRFTLNVDCPAKVYAGLRHSWHALSCLYINPTTIWLSRILLAGPRVVCRLAIVADHRDTRIGREMVTRFTLNVDYAAKVYAALRHSGNAFTGFHIDPAAVFFFRECRLAQAKCYHQ